MLNRAELNARWNQCEALYESGAWGAALDGYQRLLDDVTIGIATGEYQPDELYLFLVERVADLNIPFGKYEVVNHLLESLAELFAEHRNDYYADYLLLKRVHVAFMRGQLGEVRTLLQQMSPRIGDFTRLDGDAATLRQWEKNARWQSADAAGRHVLLALLCLEIGRYWASQGAYARALGFFTQGLSHTGGSAPPLAQEVYFPLQLGIATVQLETGALPAARQSITALQPQLDPARHPAYRTRCWELLAKLELSEGKFYAAEERLLETLTLCAERGFERAALLARLNLAHVKIFLNQTFLAREWLAAIHAVAVRNQDQAMAERAQLLLALARARSRVAEGNEAVEMLARLQTPTLPATADNAEETLPTLQRSGSFLAYFEAYTMRFHLALGLERMDEVRTLLKEMETLFGAAESAWLQARLHFLRGVVCYYEGRTYSLQKQASRAAPHLQQAATHLTQACAQLTAMGLKPELWQAQRVLIWCQTRLGYDPQAIDKLRDQTGQLLEELGHSLPPAERAFLLIDTWTAEEEALAAQVAKIELLRQQLAARRGWSALLALPQRLALFRLIHELLLSLDRHKGALSRRVIEGCTEPETTAPPPLTLWQRLWRHPRQRATLTFLVLPDFVVAIRAGFLSLQLSLSQLKRSEIRDFVREWHLNVNPENLIHLEMLAKTDPAIKEQLKERLNRRLSEREWTLKQIAIALALALCLPDLLQYMTRDTPLTIVPDDALHGFPFAALRLGQHELIDLFPLSLAFESTLRPASLDAPALQQSLLVAIPQAGRTAEGKAFRAIPGTVTELNRIERHFAPQPGLGLHRLGSLSTYVSKQELLAKLAAATFFHIACHGDSNVDHPDQSGLVIVSCPGQGEMLTLRELSALSLAQLRHITLSSCWSADNYVLPGRWVVSLPETLWRAGAHSILSSLWPVDDATAVAFMERFYAYLERMPRDKALRQTQIDCKEGNLFTRANTARRNLLPDTDAAPADSRLPRDSRASSLLDWAGYNLYGDYRVLRFAPARTGARRLLRYFIQTEE